MKKTIAVMFLENSPGKRLLMASRGQFVNREISDWVEAPALIQKFAGADKEGRENICLILCVPRHWMAVRFGDLSALQPEDRFPLPDEEILVDAAVLSPGRALLMAVKRSRLRPWLDIFEKARLYPDAFAPSCLALAAWMKQREPSSENYIHAHLQDGWLELDVFSGGTLAATSALPWRSDDPNRLTEKCRAWGAQRGIENFIVTGELKSAGDLNIPEWRKLEPEGSSHPVLSGALALADGHAVDFLPPEERGRDRTHRQGRILRGAGLWLGLWALAFAGTFGWRAAARGRELAKIEARIKALEPDARVAEKVFYGSGRGAEASPLQALRALHELAPGGVTLSGLSGTNDGPQRGRITLQGSAARYSDVVDLIERLERSALFSGAELKSSSSRDVNGSARVDFQIQCRLEGDQG